MTQEAAAPLERVQNPSQSATRPADQPFDPHSREQFQSLILDHSSNPLNFGKLVEPHSTGFGENRVCGDRCRIFLRVANNRIEAIRFVGTGCAISMASASMMTRIVDGLELPETEILIDRVRLLFTDRAVEGMVDQEKFHHSLAALLHERRLGAYGQTFGDINGAGDCGPRAPRSSREASRANVTIGFSPDEGSRIGAYSSPNHPY